MSIRDERVKLTAHGLNNITIGVALTGFIKRQLSRLQTEFHMDGGSAVEKPEEIEITSEMIEAGFSVLRSYSCDELSERDLLAREVCEAVFHAMAERRTIS